MAAGSDLGYHFERSCPRNMPNFRKSMAAMLPAAGEPSAITRIAARGFDVRRRHCSVTYGTFLWCRNVQRGNRYYRTFWAAKMLPGQASHTLLIASIMRARHQLFDVPMVLDDPVVLKLVPQAQDPDVLTEFGDSRGPIAILMRSMFAVRSRFTEDRLAQAAARGVRQYVMFGAGLDTFPWRQPDFAKDMQIFAVDHPASLIQTNRVFRQRRFARPPNLIRVPLDLEQKRIEEQLAACDFDCNTATFCSALGLMLYLDDEIVDDILRFVVSLPPRSEIVFSFVPPDADLNGTDLEIACRAAAKFATIGEPWKSRVRPRTMAERLSGLGFGEVFHLSPEVAQAQYFSGRSDTLTAPHFEQMIAAAVLG